MTAEKGPDQAGHVQELIALRTIAETLNESTGLSTELLNDVIEKLLQLTGLSSGWMFLVDEQGSYEFAAGRHLPPGLTRSGDEPMRCGDCWCLERYREGRLKNAVNILNCRRIENAEQGNWGDTCGITHHATVPIRSGSRRFGVLNVAAPGKMHFEDEELALLQSVAFQLGSAIERMRLYAAEQRRAFLFARLGVYGAELGTAATRAKDHSQLAEQALALIGCHFDWTCAALLEPSGGDLMVRAVYAGGETFVPQAHLAMDVIDWYEITLGKRCPVPIPAAEAERLAAWLAQQQLLPQLKQAAAAAVKSSGSGVTGLLLIGYDRPGELYRTDAEVIDALAELIGVTFERARLEANRRELARMEERNRLARDLHDSVSQTLFSLAMMSKGAYSLTAADGEGPLQAALEDIQALSQSALKEMRELIMQLRPAGLEEGLATGLRHYGESLKLQVDTKVAGVKELPRAVEEALWRIGQEALNNASKHAGVQAAEITLQLGRQEAVLRIADRGRGITKKRLNELTRRSFGLSTMRERAEALGGRLTLTTAYRKGTIIEAAIPLKPDREG
ncbi:GAF domain-containing sensor histidine kinase [Paenibacillus protaetiae]|uniref:histidine kinase n=1 Tax=Paenibacillus protaetiae TaxID=2509456 RepID=A0A4V0YFK0_9BACL|nr:GAF domain-containing sensor histidine kinase [Paenibacillus protaetiae]QAY67981.1 GAF domain-containing sensor histidine kinase [Paenibacillus protaetiae]